MIDRDAWIAKPQPTPEMCRLFHGVDCRKCWPTFSVLDKLVTLEEIGHVDAWKREYEERQRRSAELERSFDALMRREGLR